MYRARDIHFTRAKKIVAVKEVVSQVNDKTKQQAAIENFEREANIIASLSHRSIPKIYDFFTQYDRSFLILEYVQGRDLEKILEKIDKFIPVNIVLDWAIELCDVLGYLHNQKPESIIFRDMKPSNVMINTHNHVVLVDFGIAKNFTTEQKGTIVGTEGYSPPEQYRGNATQMADIYALGATLHHVLTRRDPQLEPPFSFAERPIRRINPNAPKEFVEIVEKALQYDPEDRYQNIKEMQTDLQALKSLREGITQTNHAEFIAAKEERLVWKFETEDELRGSPKVSRDTVFFGSYDKKLYALNSKTGNIVWEYITEGGIVSRPLIEDNVVYFGSEDNRLFAVSTRSGRLLWAYETGSPVRSSPRIAEGHIFFGSDDAHLHAVNLATTRMAWKTKVSGAVRSSPVISDGHVFFGSEGSEFYCLNYSGQILWRFTTRKAITSTPIVTPNLVCFTSLDGNVYALNKRSGWEDWNFRMQKGSISSPCRSGEKMFAGSADGNIYCLEISSGREIWKFETESQVSGSPCVIENQLFCGCSDGKVHCLDIQTGKEVWQYETGGPITSMADHSDNLLYVTSMDKSIYALRI